MYQPLMNRLRRSLVRRLAPPIGMELAPHIIREIDRQVSTTVGGLATQIAEFSHQLESLQNSHTGTALESDLIYDVGMNNGDDCEYYLVKGYRVVGIDADPALCAQVEQRFPSEIAAGRLLVVNTAIGEQEGTSEFFISTQESVWNTLLPQNTADGNWRRIQVSTRPLSALIKEYGMPYYIKIDVEGYDAVVLHDLWKREIRPDYISVECHQIEVLCRLAAMGYRKFKMTACHLVPINYQNHTITTRTGETAKFAFKPHSSGPFGADIPGPWLRLEDAIHLWLERGPGWHDFHAKKGD